MQYQNITTLQNTNPKTPKWLFLMPVTLKLTNLLCLTHTARRTRPVPNTGNVLRTQLEQPGGIRPGGRLGVNVENKSELQKHLGINQVGNIQQGPGGESLLMKQLGKQTTSDPTPDMINQVANKIPNDILHPIHPHNQKQVMY